MADEIRSIEELRKAQAAAQQQGTSIADYNNWANILEDFDTAGIESTGSYEGDVKLHQHVMRQISQLVEQAQNQQKEQQVQPQNNETEKIDDRTKNEREQVVKSSVANATSSMIMADYMKYYHLLQ